MPVVVLLSVSWFTPPAAAQDLPFELLEGVEQLAEGPFDGLCSTDDGPKELDHAWLEDGSLRLLAHCGFTAMEVDAASGAVVNYPGQSAYWQYAAPDDPLRAWSSGANVGSQELCLVERASVDEAFTITEESDCVDTYTAPLDVLESGDNIFLAGIGTSHGLFTGFVGASNLSNDGALAVGRYDADTDTVEHVVGGADADGNKRHAKMPIWLDPDRILVHIVDGGEWYSTGGETGLLVRQDDGSWDFTALLSWHSENHYPGEGDALWWDDTCVLVLPIQTRGTTSYQTVNLALPDVVCGVEDGTTDTGTTDTGGVDTGGADTGTGDAPPTSLPDDEGRFGCATLPATAPWWGGLLALVTVGRRRGRRRGA